MHNCAELLGDTAEAARARKEVMLMNEAVMKDGWDGEWFVRAYDAYSHKVGSKECEEGQIYIEPQGFCVLAGIGVKEGLAREGSGFCKRKTGYPIWCYDPAACLYEDITSNLVKSPPIHPDIRRMPVSSATTIHGSLSLRLSSDVVTEPLKYIRRPVLLM